MSSFLRQRATELRKQIETFADRVGRPVRIMEVCGTHTVSLRRHGIHSILPDSIELVSGPGCPVCVTATGYIDNALALVESHDAVVATFGDMVRVPGSDGRSLQSYVGTNQVKIIYSPMQLEALSVEAAASGRRLVFLAIGFETTIPTILRALSDAIDRRDESLTFYTAFKVVPPALKALLADDDHGIDGFLLPGHVSMIIGATAYRFLEEARVSGAIAGFEPLEMLEGIKSVLRAICEGEPFVSNAYDHVVREDGNPRALALIDRFLHPCDADWRGLGKMPSSALSLRPDFSNYDAAASYELTERESGDPPGCRCGEVVRGRCKPTDCSFFGSRCTADNPIGPCMVSSEGTCAAYLKYGDIKTRAIT